MWPLTHTEFLKFCEVQKKTQENNSFIHGVSTDTRTIETGDVFVAIKGENFDGHQFVGKAMEQGASYAIVSNTWDIKSLSSESKTKLIVVENPLDTFRVFAKNFRQTFSFPVVAIGGSNGKTTVKQMLTCLLGGNSGKVLSTKLSQNGFLGIPMTLTQKGLSKTAQIEALIVEVGIDAPGAMEQHVEVVSPNYALLTALGPEHLEGLGTWEVAMQEEWKLFSEQQNTNRLFQGADPEILKRVPSKLKEKELICLEKETAKMVKLQKNHILQYEVLSEHKIKIYNDTEERILSYKLPGLHNAQNFVLAYMTALSMGKSTEIISKNWRYFQPPPLRSEMKSWTLGVTLYNDCYNSSPASLEAALSTVRQLLKPQVKPFLLLGDMLELGNESKRWHLDTLQKLKDFQSGTLCLYGAAMYDVYKSMCDSQKAGGFAGLSVHHKEINQNPEEFLKLLPDSIENTFFLVKGSRGMNLERFSNELCKRLFEQGLVVLEDKHESRDSSRSISADHLR